VGYDLGVDLGTTFVAAAIANDSRVEMFTLGDRTVVTPAVVYLHEDGVLVSGDAASRRAVSSPDRIGREFKRRLGDPTPVMLGGASYAVTSLLGTLLADVVSKVTETEGAKPDSVVLTHPANWGPFRRELFEEVPQVAGLTGVRTVTEPEAAAAHYAASRHLADGEIIAVYDLGGGTFDATVLRKHSGGIEILGVPEGIERLGGVDFDEAILSYVNYSSGGALSELDMSDAQTAIALARLRQDCVLAKESLSVDTETAIPVFLPNRHFDIRLTRADFEDMIRAQIESTIGTLIRTLRSAQVDPNRLSAVLLVGGSSRIPLISRMISEELGRPTVVDAHPKYAVALGAATLARANSAQAPSGGATVAAAMSTAGTGGGNGNGSGGMGYPDQSGPGEHAWGGHGGGMDGTGPRPGHDGEYAAAAVNPGMATDPGAGGPATMPPWGGMPSPENAEWVPYTPTQGGGGPGPAGYGPPAGFAGQPGFDGRSGFDGQPGFDGQTTSRPPAAYGPGGPPGPPPRADGSHGRGKRWLLIAAATVVGLALLGGLGYYLWNQFAPRGTTIAGPATSAAPTAPAETAPTAEAPPAVAASVPVPSIGATIPAGDTPGFVVVSPSGRQAYVANRAAGVVTVIDTAVNKVTASIPVPAGPPQYLSFSPDGRKVYVSIWNDARTIAAVGVLDTTSNSIVATIPVRTRPFLAAVTPDGKELYVPNHDSGTVSVIDTTTNAVTTEIKVAANPHWVEFSKDGTKAYTANHESNLITVINTSDNSIAGEVPVQTSPHSLAVHPTRPLVGNVNYDSNSVTMIDTNTEQVIATIPVGKNPQDITWAPDGRFAYVVNVTDNSVSVINAETMTVTATLPTGVSPTSLAVLPNGSAAYVSNLKDGTLTVINIAG
jgi:YVTN family beta-propeller protein